MDRGTAPFRIAAGIRLAAVASFAFVIPVSSLVATNAPVAQQAPRAGHYVRNPSGHGSTIVFEHNGRIWRQQGDGIAERVTDADFPETAPTISPDGSLVAYVAANGPSDEVFVTSLVSGETSRLTYDGGLDAKVQGWLSPTEILYSTSVDSGKRGPLLFAVDVRTKRSRALPLAEAAEGCVLGDQFVYVKNQELIDSNRLYRGGYAQKIYRIGHGLVFGERRTEFRGSHPSVLLTGAYPGISRNPLCVGSRIFFLSDRDGRFNIWSMGPDGRGLVQHTFETDYDIRSMTTSDGKRIHFQKAGEIFRLDPAGGPARRIAINIPPGTIAGTERLVLDPARATDLVVSDDGARVGLVIRGKLWTIGIADRRVTCIECSSDRRVKSPVMSADGGTIFALHDASGEYDIHAYDLNAGSVRRISHAIAEPILDFSASPDGRTILARSIPGKIYQVDVASGATRRIDVASRTRPADISWSSDSRFAAFVAYASNGLGRITAFDTICGSVTYLTSGRYQVSKPVFSRGAREIYFIANRNLRSSVDDAWGPTNYWPSFDNKSLTQAVDVSALTERRPDAGPAAPTIHPAGRERRTDCPERAADRGASRSDLLLIRELPFVAGNYDGLSVSGGRLHAFSKRAVRDKWGQIVAFSRDHHGSRSAPRTVFNERIHFYTVSATGRAIVARADSGLFVSSLAADGDFGPQIPLRNLTGLGVEIDLAKEREQIFTEIWRMHRDYFWDPSMAGLDWEGERNKYRAFLSSVSSRAELADVVTGMVSELGAGHTSIGIPAPAGEERQGVARLGGEFAEADGLRVTRIFDGDLDVVEERSPLSTTTPPVAVGDRITHLDGTALTSKFMLDRMLYGRVGETAILRVAKPDGRIVETDVVPIGAGHETWLRNKAWAAGNSALVDTLSGGTVGYVHLPSAYESDFSGFIRQYAHLHQRAALILDLRGNNGGNIDPWILHFLQRRTWLHVADRHDSMAVRHPRDSFNGKLIVLIDGDTYSDGELIAEGVRRLGLGTLIGSRTSGAGKWVNDDKTLIDGSRVRIPEAGSYLIEDGKRRWVIEGTGVEPDIRVENDPYLFFLGVDAQLRAAIDHAMRAGKRQEMRLHDEIGAQRLRSSDRSSTMDNQDKSK